LATNNATQGIDQLGKESTTAAVEVKKLDSELANTNVELSKTKLCLMKQPRVLRV
jgi:hypothetical protein